VIYYDFFFIICRVLSKHNFRIFESTYVYCFFSDIFCAQVNLHQNSNKQFVCIRYYSNLFISLQREGVWNLNTSTVWTRILMEIVSRSLSSNNCNNYPKIPFIIQLKKGLRWLEIIFTMRVATDVSECSLRSSPSFLAIGLWVLLKKNNAKTMLSTFNDQNSNRYLENTDGLWGIRPSPKWF